MFEVKVWFFKSNSSTEPEYNSSKNGPFETRKTAEEFAKVAVNNPKVHSIRIIETEDQ